MPTIAHPALYEIVGQYAERLRYLVQSEKQHQRLADFILVKRMPVILELLRRTMHMANLFAMEQYLASLHGSCDRLERIAETIDFECFRDCLTESPGYDNRPQGGCPPFDPVLILKILFLQTRDNLGGRNTEIMVRDRFTWLQFLGLPIGVATPDECTIRHFRNRLTEAGLLDDLMVCFYYKLDELGYDDDGDWIADASVVACPKQHKHGGGERDDQGEEVGAGDMTAE